MASSSEESIGGASVVQRGQDSNQIQHASQSQREKEGLAGENAACIENATKRRNKTQLGSRHFSKILLFVGCCVCFVFVDVNSLKTNFNNQIQWPAHLEFKNRSASGATPIRMDRQHDEITLERCFPSNMTLSDSHRTNFPSLQHLVLGSGIPDLQSQSPRMLFHLHIQKCGGSALAAALADAFCECPENMKVVPRECRNCKPAMLSNGKKTASFHSRLTTGWECGTHASMDEIQRCQLFRNSTSLQDDVALITWLRDPVDRFLSEYHFCTPNVQQNLPCWDWTFPGTSSSYNLEAFLSLNNSFACYNRQMKKLSGCPTNSAEWTNPRFSEQCLRQAKRNLKERFVFVGLHEANAFFLNIFGTYLVGSNVTLPAEDAHKNDPTATKIMTPKVKAQQLDSATLERIKESNRYDVELYEYAKDFLCEKYQKLLLY